MMIWLVLGFSGILDSLVGGSIANWAHGGGLVAGMLMGYLSIRRR
jgi:GlpG protein